MNTPTIQDLIKKHLKGYKVDYDGIMFDGQKVIVLNAYNKISISAKSCKLFMKEIESNYEFSIEYNNCIHEEAEWDEDTYIYYVKNYVTNGFKLYTD